MIRPLGSVTKFMYKWTAEAKDLYMRARNFLSLARSPLLSLIGATKSVRRAICSLASHTSRLYEAI